MSLSDVLREHPPLHRQLRRCISWWNTISNQLKSLAAALVALLFGGDCHGLNIAIDLILTSVNAMVSKMTSLILS